MTITSKAYMNTAALVAECFPREDGWMQDVLVLTNSISDLWENEISERVDDALDSAESPFRRIMDEQEVELQGVYTSLHAEQERVDALERELLNVREQLARAPQRERGKTATENGIAFALKSAEVLQFIKDERKIDAIKAVRLATYIGLKEAKDAVESRIVQEAAQDFCHEECMD